MSEGQVRQWNGSEWVWVDGPQNLRDLGRAHGHPDKQPEVDMFYADMAFLETKGSTKTKVRAAIWAYLNLTDSGGCTLNEIRDSLTGAGFEVIPR